MQEITEKNIFTTNREPNRLADTTRSFMISPEQQLPRPRNVFDNFKKNLESVFGGKKAQTPVIDLDQTQPGQTEKFKTMERVAIQDLIRRIVDTLTGLAGVVIMGILVWIMNGGGKNISPTLAAAGVEPTDDGKSLHVPSRYGDITVTAEGTITVTKTNGEVVTLTVTPPEATEIIEATGATPPTDTDVPPTAAPSATNTPEPTNRSWTSTPFRPTNSPTFIPTTPTNTPQPSATNTSTPKPSDTDTKTPKPSDTPTSSKTPQPTRTPRATATASYTATDKWTPTLRATLTPSMTETIPVTLANGSSVNLVIPGDGPLVNNGPMGPLPQATSPEQATAVPSLKIDIKNFKGTFPDSNPLQIGPVTASSSDSVTVMVNGESMNVVKHTYDEHKQGSVKFTYYDQEVIEVDDANGETMQFTILKCVIASNNQAYEVRILAPLATINGQVSISTARVDGNNRSYALLPYSQFTRGEVLEFDLDNQLSYEAQITMTPPPGFTDRNTVLTNIMKNSLAAVAGLKSQSFKPFKDSLVMANALWKN